ncbi:MAG: thioredoxin family protein [Planctomycetota bacterium]
MTVRRLVVALIAVAGLAVGASAGPHGIDGPVRWRTDAFEAVSESRSTGKPIVVMFTAEWCGFCKKMLRETYRDESVARHVADCFVPLIIDADEHAELIKDLGVTAFPTTLIFSPEGDLVSHVRGFKNAEALRAELGQSCPHEEQVADADIPVLR